MCDYSRSFGRISHSVWGRGLLQTNPVYYVRCSSCSGIRTRRIGEAFSSEAPVSHREGSDWPKRGRTTVSLEKQEAAGSPSCGTGESGGQQRLRLRRDSFCGDEVGRPYSLSLAASSVRPRRTADGSPRWETAVSEGNVAAPFFGP